MRRKQPTYFDPVADSDDAYNTVRIEILQIYDALDEAGHSEACDLIRNPDAVSLADLGLDPSPGDPRQLRISRKLAKDRLSTEQLNELRDKSGRLRW